MLQGAWCQSPKWETLHILHSVYKHTMRTHRRRNQQAKHPMTRTSLSSCEVGKQIIINMSKIQAALSGQQPPAHRSMHTFNSTLHRHAVFKSDLSHCGQDVLNRVSTFWTVKCLQELNCWQEIAVLKCFDNAYKDWQEDLLAKTTIYTLNQHCKQNFALCFRTLAYTLCKPHSLRICNHMRKQCEKCL